jgi:hypothetical protein
MLLMNMESRKAGGSVVTHSLISSVLESLVSWNPACRVRGRGVAKVPTHGTCAVTSLAPYPIARAP